MSMKNGIKQWVNTALDAKDELCNELIQGGVDPKEALLASTVLTKSGVAEKLDKHFKNQDAATITSRIKSHSDSAKLN